MFLKNTRKIKISASQLISNMICMNIDHNKKFGLLKFYSGYGKFNLNSPKGYSLKIINAQTASTRFHPFFAAQVYLCRRGMGNMKGLFKQMDNVYGFISL